jgi:transposase-like protein
VTDGNPGVLKAIDEVFPNSLKHRCQKHRMDNVLGKAPAAMRAELKAAILESFQAETYAEGLRIDREVIARYGRRLPTAMKCLGEELEACLQVLKLPKPHHRRLRTSNCLERTFGEKKRRTKVIPHFFSERAAIKLVYATMLATTAKWRGIRMDVFTSRGINELRAQVFGKSGQRAA